MPRKLPKLIVIFGPTASGKSDLAIRIANESTLGGTQAQNGEIISADSRQIYRGMNIGTAKEALDKKQTKFKPDKNAKNLYYGLVQQIPHYMIDIVDLDQEYTLANYKKDAIRVIDNIIKRDKIPILVGGTGLYIDAITKNLQIPTTKPDKKLRAELNNKNLSEIKKIYKKIDPKGYKSIDLKNKRRLIRAIEVSKTTGKPFSAQSKKGKPLYDVEEFIIDIPRDILYERINQRVDRMISGGLIDEVKYLIKKYPQNLPAFSGIGYKEIIAYLNGKIGKEEMIELIKRNSRRYAKRQITWMRRESIDTN